MPRGPTPAGRRMLLSQLSELLVGHDDHEWAQVGRCVYCTDCNVRLFQGRIPKTHTKVRLSNVNDREPRSTTEMRDRWGMDSR